MFLQANEVPMRYSSTYVDGKTNRPETCSGPIGKKLNGGVLKWLVTQFKRIPNPSFSEIHQSIVDDLSTDHYYG